MVAIPDERMLDDVADAIHARRRRLTKKSPRTPREMSELENLLAMLEAIEEGRVTIVARVP